MWSRWPYTSGLAEIDGRAPHRVSMPLQVTFRPLPTVPHEQALMTFSLPAAPDPEGPLTDGGARLQSIDDPKSALPVSRASDLHGLFEPSDGATIDDGQATGLPQDRLQKEPDPRPPQDRPPKGPEPWSPRDQPPKGSEPRPEPPTGQELAAPTPPTPPAPNKSETAREGSASEPL